MKIPIVMVCDQNYILQTRVTIWTMRKSTCEDVFLEVTILCAKNMTDNAKGKLKELENILTNISIIFYMVESDMFQNVKKTAHVPVASLYRLIIPDVIKESKCLFLDGDLVVKTDLQSLYLCELGDFYIAAVRDRVILNKPEDAIKHAELYGFQSIENYVNAGVMLFNLDKIREDNLKKLIFRNLDKSYRYMDQDILNKVCEGKIMHLDMKYNMMLGAHETKSFSDGIIHFVGKFKPWNNNRLKWAKEWWSWAKEALESKEYDKLYQQALERTRQDDWSYIKETCLKEEIVIIIGYSDIGIALTQALKRDNRLTRFLYCDNSKAKQNLSNEDEKIYAVEELAKKYCNALWINTSQLSYININLQLNKLGIKEDRIIIYRNKSMTYFEMIDDEFFEYEFLQLQLRLRGSLDR